MLMAADGRMFYVVGWDGETGEPLIAVPVSVIVDEWQLCSDQYLPPTPEQEQEWLRGYELQDDEVMP